MVRKVSAIMCALVLICATCTTAQAASHDIYENSTISTQYLTYFEDIVNRINPFYDYVAFRSGQNTYTMVVGHLEYDSGAKIIRGEPSSNTGTFHGYEYTFYTDGTNYSNNLNYVRTPINDFELSIDTKLVYTSVGDFEYPTFVERGEQFEFIQTFIISISFFAVYISRIFTSGSRRKR